MMLDHEKLLDKAKSLPALPGCYLMRKDEKIIYVGKAKNLTKRVQSYFNQTAKSLKTQVLVSHITDFDFILAKTEVEALIKENLLIKEYSPRYNIRLRDDKGYPYIVIDNSEPFSRPVLVRELKNRKNKTIFGPFVAGSNIKEVLRILVKAFRLRDCSVAEMKRRSEPCLLYQIHQCSAPCVNLISQGDYDKNLQTACSFFEQKEQEVLELIRKMMFEKATSEQFELAAIYRDSLDSLEKFVEFYKNQRLSVDNVTKSMDIIGHFVGEQEVEVGVKMVRHDKVFADRKFSFIKSELQSIEDQLLAFIIQYYFDFYGELPSTVLVELGAEYKKLLEKSFDELNMKVSVIKQMKKHSALLGLASKEATEQQLVRLKNQDSPYIGMTKLQELLCLKERPQRLECYDVAIWQGGSPTASQIVYEDGLALKHKYRLFHLEVREEGNNDFEMMREVLSRRLSHGDFPDVFVVDGGLGQVNIFKEVLEEFGEQIPVVGIAKSKESGNFQSASHRSEERLIIPGRKNPYVLKRNLSLFRILTQMRDEAHRFSRKLHHKEEKKRVIHSQLDEVPHIGPRIKRKILKNLKKPLEELAELEVYQIMDELNVSVKVAKSIKEFFFPR